MISLLSSLSDITFLGIPLIIVSGLAEMLIRFALNAVFVYIIVNFFYYPRARRRDYYFAFVMLSVSIFMMIYLMDGSKIKIGAALGLFAVFGIIRYRTESVPIREMTYLFFVVAISVINGMSARLSVAELLAANLLFVVVVAVAESNHSSSAQAASMSATIISSSSLPHATTSWWQTWRAAQDSRSPAWTLALSTL